MRRLLLVALFFGACILAFGLTPLFFILMPTVAPTPTPEPTPNETCEVVNDDFLTPTLLMDDTLRAVITQAQQEIGDVCGQPADESYCKLAQKLTDMGYPAFVTERGLSSTLEIEVIPGGFMSDAVFVKRPSDGLLEERKAVYSVNLCWMNKWKGVWSKSDE